jgi:outer membrane protein assembly factor BamB
MAGFFVITKDNNIIGVDIQNGETVWTSDLIENRRLFAPIMYAPTLWVTSNKGLVFAFPGSGNTGKAIEIPGNVFHTPPLTPMIRYDMWQLRETVFIL